MTCPLCLILATALASAPAATAPIVESIPGLPMVAVAGSPVPAAVSAPVDPSRAMSLWLAHHQRLDTAGRQLILVSPGRWGEVRALWQNRYGYRKDGSDWPRAFGQELAKMGGLNAAAIWKASTKRTLEVERDIEKLHGPPDHPTDTLAGIRGALRVRAKHEPWAKVLLIQQHLYSHDVLMQSATLEQMTWALGQDYWWFWWD